MIRKTIHSCFIVVIVGLVVALGSRNQDLADQPVASVQENEVSGMFTPTGPPSVPPVRIEAGQSCIVDLKQSYNISGTLTGNLEIDYRILVEGPCGSPPGTFDEEWIAYGKFSGSVNGSAANGNLSYTAQVKAGGDVEGQMVFGRGLEGRLLISGNFGDGKLFYRGQVNEE